VKEIGKREVPVKEIGKREVPVKEIGKREVPVKEIGKRSIPNGVPNGLPNGDAVKNIGKRSFGFNSFSDNPMSNAASAAAASFKKAIPSGWESFLSSNMIAQGVAYYEQVREMMDKWFEGDMHDNTNDARAKDGKPVMSTGTEEDKQWLWEGGIVPYEIANPKAFAPKELDVVNKAIKDVQSKTCIKFVLRTTEEDYVSFVKGKVGCSSDVARLGGKQTIDLQTGCINKIGEVQHEILHVLGLYHEQSRQDRDKFVDIIWDNIADDKRNQYEKYVSMTGDLPYDYESIMHYGFNFFAKDIKQPAILPKKKAKIGNRDVMSAGDVQKLKHLYSCK